MSKELSMSVYPTNDQIPYQHVEHIGRGAYANVDKVKDSAGKVFARKVMRVSSRLSREDIENEARIMRKLQHPHIVLLEGFYQSVQHFGIVMLPVADGNLQDYLTQADSRHSDGAKAMSIVVGSPRCLLQAINYMHEMRVKHKDIKPANILIENGRPILADFGISKDLIDADTTASQGAVGPHTPTYCAPEVALQERRRGRAADIFSLGCVFLEVATVLRASEENELERFRLHRRKRTNSYSYALCATELLEWIAMCFKDSGQLFRHMALEDVTQMAFLMLDPNPETRITARQLVAMVSAKPWSQGVTNPCCSGDFEPRFSKIPLHSIFKSQQSYYSPFPSRIDDMEVRIPKSWEEAKKAWLSSHM